MKLLTNLKMAILLLICGPSAAGAFGEVPPDTSSGATPSQIQQKLTPKEALSLIESNSTNQNFIILDVRTPEEFKDGYIKNAVLLNFHLPTFESDLDKLDKDKTYIVYCRLGNRSGKACNLMKKKGFKTVYDIGGGITQWKKDGLPLSKESDKVAK
jgi:rhodanese-related sulfurtransferase